MKLYYQGAFRYPYVRSEIDPVVRTGYGFMALTWNPKTKAIIGDSHVHRGWVNSVTPVETKVSADWKTLPVATQLREFGDPASSLRVILKDTKLRVFGGMTLKDDVLYFNYHDNYPVSWTPTDVPSFGKCDWPSLENQTGLWKVGDFHQKHTSEYMCVDPFTGWIACGRGWGAGSGSNSHGPSLFIFNPDNPEEAKQLMFYNPKEGNEFPDWANTDVWEGIVWTKDVLLFCGSKGSNETWYGAPTENPFGTEPDRCRTGKGYHSTSYKPIIAEYDPQTFELKNIHDLTQNFFSKCGAVGGMCHDPETNKIYLTEKNQEHPICHVFKMILDKTDPEPDPDPKPTPEIKVNVSVDIEGIGKFTGALSKE